MTSEISAIFDSCAFDPVARQNVGIAYDRIAQELGLSSIPDSINTLVAEKIMEIARDGERDPDRLYSATISAFAGKP